MNVEEFLGQEIIDQVSGLKGVCTSITFKHTGSIVIGIQPRGDGNTLPDAQNIDPDAIECVIDGKRIPIVPVTDPTDYLGKMVKERVTSLIGLAIERAIYANGCEFYRVRHQKVGQYGEIVWSYLPSIDLSLVEEKNPTSVPTSRTGGPSEAVPRR